VCVCVCVSGGVYVHVCMRMGNGFNRKSLWRVKYPIKSQGVFKRKTFLSSGRPDVIVQSYGRRLLLFLTTLLILMHVPPNVSI
jgi:hypothetical protein